MEKRKKVCLLISSQDCPHCIRARNRDGKVLPFTENNEKGFYGKYALDYEFVKNILTVNETYPHEEWNFLNVHFNSGFEVSSISYYSLINNKKENALYIQQTIFEPYKNGEEILTLREIHVINNKKRVKELCENKKLLEKAKWNETVKEFIPNPETIMLRYTIAKPTFIFYFDDIREKYRDISGVQELFYARGDFVETSKQPPYHLIGQHQFNFDPLKSLEKYDKEPFLLSPDLRVLVIPAFRTAFNTRER